MERNVLEEPLIVLWRSTSGVFWYRGGNWLFWRGVQNNHVVGMILKMFVVICRLSRLGLLVDSDVLAS